MKALKQRYDMLRVGQAMYCSHFRSNSARIVGVGRKWIHLSGGTKIQYKDIIDWWYG